MAKKTKTRAWDVAEHLESKHADFYVECLSSGNAKKLIFTAASPGQGGEGHYNEQPKEYWIEYNDLLVTWGQNICRPISPFCSRCAVLPYCRQVGVARNR